MKANRLSQKGFTIVELMIAMAMSLVVMAGIYMTFKSQQDSYLVQNQLTAAQQNVRGAMFMMTRDIQMAGYYTNCDSSTFTIDWDDLDNDNDTTTGTEAVRPLIYAGNNVNVSGIRNNTDVLVIVKAGSEGRALAPGEGAALGTITLLNWTNGPINCPGRDLDGDGQADLNTTGKKFGVLVKQDLRMADIFEVNADSNTITPPAGLSENYDVGDLIFRVDIIIYRVDDDPDHPALRRKNLGSNNGYQVVAENIDNFQVQYVLSSGSIVNGLTSSEVPSVRAVKIFLCARTALPDRAYTDPNTYANLGDNPNTSPGDRYRRRVLSCTIKTRNIGL